MQNATRRPISSLALVGICALGMGGLTSCNIVGPAGYFIAGPGDVDAEFDLDADRPTLIFIDDRSSKLPRRQFRTLIAETAQANLVSAGVVSTIVDTQAATAVASQDKNSRPMSIASIGEAVGAEIVIYATVDEFTISPDGQTVLPTSQLRVKVIDVVTGERAWPQEREGYPLRLTVRDRQGGRDATTSMFDLQQALAVWMGTGLAELFYDVEVTSSTRYAGQ